VVQNPATSSPGLAFLLATIGRFGESGYLAFWNKLKKNDVLITNGWNDAYWGKFSAASDGSRPIVVSYASSPAAEVYFSKEKLETAPTAAVIDNGSAFRQIEFAGILKGTRQLELSKHLMDFLLSRPFQEDIPLQMFVFPANTKAVLPQVFVTHSLESQNPVTLPSDLISKNREVWIDQWTDLMLH
jgi:thiamine transport system substrate-binding protein